MKEGSGSVNHLVSLATYYRPIYLLALI